MILKTLPLNFVVGIILLVGLFLLLLFAPRTPRTPVACGQMQEKSLRSLEFGTIRAKDFLHWLSNNSPFAGTHIDTDSTKMALWGYDEIGYEAAFRKEVLTRIMIKWDGPKFEPPIASEILTCFGQPDLYQALSIQVAEAKQLNLSLWYLDKGIVVNTYVEPQAIDGNLEMTTLIFVAPGNAEEMIAYHP